MDDQSSIANRKKAPEKITTPEQLTDYLKVTNPGIWTLFAAIIVLLIGFFVWGMTGTLETFADGMAEVKDGEAVIMVSENNGNDITSGMIVRIDGEDFHIRAVDKDDYGRSVAYASVSKTDGTYDVKIVTESIHPIQFLFD